MKSEKSWIKKDLFHKKNNIPVFKKIQEVVNKSGVIENKQF